jgi:hypothetical protein
MHRSVYVQDERYIAGAWSFFAIHGITTLISPYMSMHRSVYVQDERYVAGAWSFFAIQGITALINVDTW